MEAPGLDGEGDGTAGEGEDVAGFAPVLESGGDAFRGIEDGPRCAAGDGVFLGVVVERAVELDVGERDGGRRSGSEGGEPRDLGFHELGEFRW